MKKIQEQLDSHLRAHGDLFFPQHHFKEVYQYALFPTGKLFRPLLAWASYLDHQITEDLVIGPKDNISYFCSAVETHHTYTLLHDDLPCMDDDNERRGRPSSHIQFNEWKALLAGDGLLNMSYQLLSKIDHLNQNLILKFFSWALGPKGLIQGQVLDLSNEMTQSFQHLVRTHQLKTSRLIQVSLLGGHLCSHTPIKRKTLLDLARLGNDMGVLFQFFDDLSELAGQEVSGHELKVNPWIHYFELSKEETLRTFTNTFLILKDQKLNKTSEVFHHYLAAMKKKFLENEKMIYDNLKKYSKVQSTDLAPIISLF